MQREITGVKLAAKTLRDAGLKITPQRVSILSELIGNQDHPTADAVYQKIKKKLPNISFDTVNRTLVVFAKKGVIKIAEGHSAAKRYDPTTEPHHHFHCVNCSRIIDFENKDYNKIEPPNKITSKHQVMSQRVILEGVCQYCKSR